MWSFLSAVSLSLYLTQILYNYFCKKDKDKTRFFQCVSNVAIRLNWNNQRDWTIVFKQMQLRLISAWYIYSYYTIFISKWQIAHEENFRKALINRCLSATRSEKTLFLRCLWKLPPGKVKTVFSMKFMFYWLLLFFVKCQIRVYPCFTIQNASLDDNIELIIILFYYLSITLLTSFLHSAII